MTQLARALPIWLCSQRGGLLVFSFFLLLYTTHSPAHPKTQQCARSALDHQTLASADFLEGTQEARRELCPKYVQYPLCGGKAWSTRSPHVLFRDITESLGCVSVKTVRIFPLAHRVGYLQHVLHKQDTDGILSRRTNRLAIHVLYDTSQKKSFHV